MVIMKKIQLALVTVFMCQVSLVSANFYIDYQGTNENKALDYQEMRNMKGAPDGYRVLTDKSYGMVHQIGKPSGEYDKVNGFGTALTLKDTVSMIMPEKWIAYVDENLTTANEIAYQAKNEGWVNVLAQIGQNYGYRFIVDWEQKLIQVSPDRDYLEPDYNAPITLKDEESGRSIFIYSAQPVSTGGTILVNGKAMPFKIID